MLVDGPAASANEGSRPMSALFGTGAGSGTSAPIAASNPAPTHRSNNSNEFAICQHNV